jgi:molybdate transport repressor ModE-like protein
MDWEDLKVFLAVARAGSLAAASRRLRLSQATVWRRMRALDESLDATLFERRSTGYVLTAQGTSFLRALDGVDETISSARRRLAEGAESPEGEVRISLPEFLSPLIGAKTPELIARHPRVRLESLSASPLAQLGVRDADVAIRAERPLVGGYWISEPYPIPFALYASPDYVRQHGAPHSLDALAGHRLIDFDHSIEHAAPGPWRGADLREVTVVFRSSSPHARLAAARRGAGLAMLPECLVGDDPTLRTLIPASSIGALDLMLCVNSELMREPRIAAVVEFLDQTLQGIVVRWPTPAVTRRRS